MNENLQMILNSLGGGPTANRLVAADMDPGVLRPWRGPDGKSYVTVNAGRKDGDGNALEQHFTTNTPAMLRREDWLRIDREVVMQAKKRLRFWQAIRNANAVTIPNGMGTLAVQHAVGTYDADAIFSMDPIRKSERSRSVFDTVSTPLPVVHSDGSFSARAVAVSQRSGMPLDTTGIMAAGRKIGEAVEQLALGVSSTYKFAGGTVYGATNFPSRNTFTMTSPETGGWKAKDTVDQILAMIQLLQDQFFYGPYVLFHSNRWNLYLENDYTTAYTAGTFRDRVSKISQISDVQNIDYLSDYQMILMQLTPDVMDALVGMDVTTVQWQEEGGMELCFKVMAIMVPRPKATQAGYCGIVHGSATAPTTTTTSTTTTTTTTTP